VEIKVTAGDVTQVPADAVIVNLFEGVETPGGATGAVDKALRGAITRLIAAGEVKGKLNAVAVVHTFGQIAAERVAIVGLGKQADFTLDRARQAAASAAKALRKLGCKHIATVLHGAGIGGSEPAQAAQAVTEGTILGLYTFKKYQSKKEDSGEIAELTIVEREAGKVPAIEQGVAVGRILAEATNFARDLANEPANQMTPTIMAQKAQEIAAAYGLEFEALGREKMKELGMGALLGVAQGSQEPPQLIVLRYWGAGKDSPQPGLGLIGKGITFDSGGLSIKPAEGMGDMKGDMSGGAAVLGAMRAIAQLQPKINVTGLVPATENLPSGSAFKPGDILKALDGKTIEVISTDAEGRLILADALAYARKLGLSPLVDVATLTGACVVALGTVRTGAFTNNPALLAQVIAAGDEAGEKIWQLPTDEEYKELFKSEVADLKNSGGRWAGAITGAMFVGAFAEDTPWVHLDIAGTSRLMEGKESAYAPRWGSGVMVRTLANLAVKLAEK
jgi:leucyl aminopeptidase